jgi:Clp amino terminal domain, pathogenicity island component
MFERFTDRARRVLVLAQEEARLLDHNFIGTEHLLLGLVRESDGVAAKALALLDIRLEVVRQKVQETIGPASTPQTGSPPFTPRAKKVLELSLREALQLGHNYIGTEHILLGLIREGEGVAAQVLVGLGADLARVRQQVLFLLAGSPAHVAAHEAIATPPAPVRPRCARCGADLSGSVLYTALEARPSEEQSEEGSEGESEEGSEGESEQSRGPLTVTVFYCGRCGGVLVPAQEGFPLLRAPAATSARLGGPGGGGGSGHGAAARSSERLPSDPLGPVGLEDVPEDARVELLYHNSGVIDGTVAGAEVHLSGLGRSRRGSADGTWGEVAFGAAWSIGNVRQAPENPSTPSPAVTSGGFGQLAVMSGRFGQLDIKLKGDFQLSPDQTLERAGLVGQLGGQNILAEVSAADGGLGTTSAVVAEGTLGETPFELFAAFSDDSKRAVVRGLLDGRAISLDATRSDPATSVHIVGSYFGEPPLLALLLGVVVRFL